VAIAGAVFTTYCYIYELTSTYADNATGIWSSRECHGRLWGRADGNAGDLAAILPVVDETKTSPYETEPVDTAIYAPNTTPMRQ